MPISIVAVTGESLEMRGLQNVENLNATIPNLSVMGAGGTASPSFRVRGIPGVGTYVDGIYQVSTAGLLTEEFVDIDRLEVLRGPQGTLFGRESIGGAVRIFTKRPAEEFSGNVKGTIGSLNRRDAVASLNLPLSDNVRTKFTASSANRDGYIRSLETGAKAGGIDQSLVSGDILWTPGDRFEIRGQMSSMETEFTEPRVADAVWLGAAWYPATAGLLYHHAGLPYDQISQMAGWPGGEVGKWENRSEITIPNRYEREQASLDVKFDITDSISIDFLTGYTDVRARTYIDYDNSQWGLVEDTSNSRTNLFSEEIQLTGGNDRVQWVAGVFYWDTQVRTRSVGYAMQEFNLNPRGVNGNPINHPSNDNEYVAALYASPFCENLRNNPGGPPAGTCESAMAFYKGFSTLLATPMGGRLSQSGNDGLALFGEVTVSLTDKLTLAVGARQHDQDNYSQQMTPTNQAPLYVNRDFAADPLEGLMNLARTTSSFKKSTGRASLRYQFNDELMGYVSYSEGFNPGGSIFISRPGDNVLVQNDWSPEVISNLEVGIRSDLADGRVRLNATVFDTSWDNAIAALAMRFCYPDGHCEDTRSVVNQNVGKAHATGLELEMTIAATENLLFNVNLGYLDTGYDEITVPTGPAAGYVAGQTEFAQAPENTYNLGVQHTASLGNGGTLTTRFDYSYVSQYWRANDPTLRVAWYASTGSGIPPGFSDESGDFGQFNARLTYEPAEGNWEWSVFGTNLTDEYQLNSGFFHGIWGYDFATVARPREIGSSLTFRF